MDISNLFFNFCFFFLTNVIVFTFYVFVSNFPLLHCYEDYEADRLSELPNSLILEILSLLPTRDAVQTTLLSKGWRNLWTTVPCLDFELPQNNQNSYKFQAFVSGVLTLWKGSRIKKFSLSCRLDDILDWWLLFAIEKQVEELKIWLMESLEDQIWVQYEYPIPSFLYLCSSIKKLDLYSCALEVKDEENVQWDKLLSLKVYTLEGLSAKTVNKLLSGAPRLEILNLQVLGTRELLNIRSSSLKMLKIHILPDITTPMLRIWAPNLESLKLSGIAYTRCLLKVPSLNNAVLGFGCCIVGEEFLRRVLLSLRHVEKITLSDLCIERLSEMKKNDMPTPISNAKFLKLYASSCNKVLDVLEVFPQLKTLVIVRDDVIRESCKSRESRQSNVLVEPRTNFQYSFLENLREVEVMWLVPDTSVYLVMEILLKNSHVLEKMVFRPILYELEVKMITSMLDFEAEEEKKVLSMQRSSPNAEVFVIGGGRELAYETFLMFVRLG